MSLDPSSLESDLRRLRAAALDASLLARLDACAGETWTNLDPAEITFERRLHGITPARLSPALMTSLESAVSGVRFPSNEKIVHFPKVKTSAPRQHRGWWGAAAAVAITGAVTALLMPVNHDNGNGELAASSHKTEVTLPGRATDRLVPAGFNRDLGEASDEGVIWQANNQPHRVLKVVYRDRVTFKDANGGTYQVEQPRVEYILVPAKTD